MFYRNYPARQELHLTFAKENRMFTFPEIKTTRTVEQQRQKIYDEMKEYHEAESEEQDKEAIDILHAAETFIRVRFRGREDELRRLIESTIAKNEARGYYNTKCF